MSNLPGNPHHNLAAKIQNQSELPSDLTSPSWPLSEISERLAALAYEQRTANLIAIAAHRNRMGKIGDAYWEEIADRLGIEAGKCAS
ncbi:hypothetical protein NMP99_02955 [Glutamicibacter mishrai]|uniref:hypothetical protein n=1 Tax=Glutamicibacter mishrai TaxID=1775880 RepID=UPI0020CB8533|nr:hypothetical protein [Glutamicibacter mishrai]UTT40234.1 hypothetical protein NMP99_02665 [Glutamicibacter mishrai]UTT40285.1 hypothetical protein NMP99_02955 [Glutamicibacter mishrai]